jgi:hypothetical protein
MWLGHADARQVYDLPGTNPFTLKRSMTATDFRVGDPEGLGWVAPASHRLAAHQHGRAIAKELRSTEPFDSIKKDLPRLSMLAVPGPNLAIRARQVAAAAQLR